MRRQKKTPNESRSCGGIVGMLCVILLAGAFGGCAHSLVYDENRDRQATEAKKAAAELKLADSVSVLEKSISDLSALEEARAKDRSQLLFELELTSVAHAPALNSNFNAETNTGITGLLTAVNTRMKELGVD